MTPTKSLEQQIRERVLEIGQHERRSVEEKIELGRLVLSLQKLNDDRDLTGKPSYEPARTLIHQWIAPLEVADQQLQFCTYCALRSSSQQVHVLADAGATVTAIHAAIQACERKGKGEFVKFVANVKRGKIKANHYMMKRYYAQKQADFQGDMPVDVAVAQNGDPRLVVITIKDADGISQDGIHDGLMNLLARVDQPLLEKKLNEAVDEWKKKGRTLKHWRLE